MQTRLMYGTAWKGHDTDRLVDQALHAGFRSFDTAPDEKHYREDLVGKSLRSFLNAGSVKRADIHIQTKFSWSKELHDQCLAQASGVESLITNEVKKSIETSLTLLTSQGSGCGENEAYLDSVLLHSPLPTWHQNLKAWKALESFVPGKVRALGICNSSLPFIKMLFESQVVTVKPMIIQNPFSSNNNFDHEIIMFCRQNNMTYQAFRILTGNQDLLAIPPVIFLSDTVGITVQEALYCLVTSLENVVALDGTINNDRMVNIITGLARVDAWKSQNCDWWVNLKTEFCMIIGKGSID